MPLQIDLSLKKFNTFGFDVKAKKALLVKSEAELLSALREINQAELGWQVLGSGSNVVLRDDLPGLTLLMDIRGRRLVEESGDAWVIEAGAGENWHQFVEWTIDQGWPGLENLALIPGTLGAAPIQNIGAYGMEVGERIVSVRALDTHRLTDQNPWVELSNSECQFGYRNSLFKRDPSRYVVTSVRFSLPKNWQPNLSYAELSKYLGIHAIHASETSQRNSPSPTAKDIFNAVCAIRRSKLPDPDILGNAGSFFHNPIVDEDKHRELKEKFPTLISYPAESFNGKLQFKLAAGWLIDQCGLKGYRKGSVGVYEKQALVLVHYGSGTGKELLALADEVRQAVTLKFGVVLSQEPVIYPQ